MENKFYLTFLKLYENNSEGKFYYECVYENGIKKRIIFIPFDENMKIETKID